jgi:hypothetical protein
MAPWANAGWLSDQGGWYKNKAAGGGAMSWTPTDAKFNNAAGFVDTTTFTACNIGTASSTRLVIVGVSVRNNAGAVITVGCTVGGTTATLVSSGESATSGVDVALFQANITSGTTANIVISTTAGKNDINEIAIGVGCLDGVNATATSVATAGTYAASQNSPYLAGSSITVPTGGIGIGVGAASTAVGTPGWVNITSDATSTIAGTVAVTMGHVTTTGAITPSAIFGNFAQAATLAAAWGP